MRKSEDRDWEAFGKSLWIPECGFSLRNDLLPVNGFDNIVELREEPSIHTAQSTTRRSISQKLKITVVR